MHAFPALHNQLAVGRPGCSATCLNIQIERLQMTLTFSALRSMAIGQPDVIASCCIIRVAGGPAGKSESRNCLVALPAAQP